MAWRLDFQGTKRFELIRKLGGGAMGQVFEAHDHLHGDRVALKLLRHHSPELIYRFKREFRALVELDHPNLVAFRELASEGDHWFLTMELIHGEDFLSHIQTDSGECALERLRDAVVQLASGLDRLHTARLVHRDLKPSNILVTRDGRVVVVDFGLVAEGQRAGADNVPAVGTPAFMAPEQARWEQVTPAADWYAIGVTLHLALTGSYPPPVRPEFTDNCAGQATLHAQLHKLCWQLLAQDPGARPDGAAVLSLLGESPTGGATPRPAESFVGREQLATQLQQTFGRTTAGGVGIALVRGLSGMGKTALARHFLGRVRTDTPPVLILEGRCRPNETIAYNGFDGVVDDLSVHLLGLSDQELVARCPADLDLLALLFPTLNRLSHVVREHHNTAAAGPKLRTRAIAAMSNLLTRVAQTVPVVVFLDDLQWAGAETLDLLQELTRSPGLPRCMVLATVRTENLGGDSPLQAAVDQLASRDGFADLEVGPLSPTEQRTMLSHILGERQLTDELSAAYWAEAGGHPLFTAELARLAQQDSGAMQPSGNRQLGDVLEARLGRLPTLATDLLELLTAAGGPLPTELLAFTAGVDEAALGQALAILEAGRFVRESVRGTERLIDLSHDRVRETIATCLDDDALHRLHQTLAMAYEARDQTRVDILAHHWLAAGQPARATAYFLSAAQDSRRQFAFSRAADLYHAALESGCVDADQEPAVIRAFAEACASAGRCTEAATAYLTAAHRSPTEVGHELTRLAAEEFLRGGDIEQGLATLGKVLGQLGMRVAATRRRALWSLIVQRARIAARGLKWKARPASDTPERELRWIDTLFTASSSLGMIDHIRGADFQTRQLLRALRCGEERRVCRALAIEVVFRGSEGNAESPAIIAVADTVHRLAQRTQEPALLGYAHLASGALAAFRNRLPEANADLSSAASYFDQGVGYHWERTNSQFMWVLTAAIQGQYTSVAPKIEQILLEAERTRNLSTRPMFLYLRAWTHLANDTPDRVPTDLDGALAEWPDKELYLAHWLIAEATASALLYEGNTDAARATLEQVWPGLRSSMLARVTLVALRFQYLYGLSVATAPNRALLRRSGRRLRKIPGPYAHGLGQLLLAISEARSGAVDACQELLTSAFDHFERSDAQMFAQPTRYRLGELLGGDEGTQLTSAATAWMTEHGIRNVPRFVRYVAPWLGREAPR